MELRGAGDLLGAEQSGFVESVANTLVKLGHEAAGVRTERFGPTGS